MAFIPDAPSPPPGTTSGFVPDAVQPGSTATPDPNVALPGSRFTGAGKVALTGQMQGDVDPFSETWNPSKTVEAAEEYMTGLAKGASNAIVKPAAASWSGLKSGYQSIFGNGDESLHDAATAAETASANAGWKPRTVYEQSGMDALPNVTSKLGPEVLPALLSTTTQIPADLIKETLRVAEPAARAQVYNGLVSAFGKDHVDHTIANAKDVAALVQPLIQTGAIVAPALGRTMRSLFGGADTSRVAGRLGQTAEQMVGPEPGSPAYVKAQQEAAGPAPAASAPADATQPEDIPLPPEPGPATPPTNPQVPAGKPVIRPKNVPTTPVGAAPPQPAVEAPTEPATPSTVTPSQTVIPPAAASAPPAAPVLSRFERTADEGPQPTRTPAEKAATIQNFKDALPSLGEVFDSQASRDYNATGQDYTNMTSSKDPDVRARNQAVVDNESAAMRAEVKKMAPGVDASEVAKEARGRAPADAINALQQSMDDLTGRAYSKAKQNKTPINMAPFMQWMEENKHNFYPGDGKNLWDGVMNQAKQLGFDDPARAVTAQDVEALRKNVLSNYSKNTGHLIRGETDAATGETTPGLVNVMDDRVAKSVGEQVFQDARAIRRKRGELLDNNDLVSKFMNGEGATPELKETNRRVKVGDMMDTLLRDPTSARAVLSSLRHGEAYLRGRGEVAAADNLKSHIARTMQAFRDEIGAGAFNRGASGKMNWNQAAFNSYIRDMEPLMDRKYGGVFSDAAMQRWEKINKAGNDLKLDSSYKGARAQTVTADTGDTLRQNAANTVVGGVSGLLSAKAGPLGGLVGAGLEMSGIEQKGRDILGGQARAQARVKAERMAANEKRIINLRTP